MLKRNKGLRQGNSSLKRTPLRKRSKGYQPKKDTAAMHAFFLSLWNQMANRRCWSCSKYVGSEFSTVFFHHLLPKSTFPEHAYKEENIYFCCFNCHSLTEHGYPPEAILKATNEIKEKYKHGN